ncbi:MAG: hypothetical protein V4615_12600 [Bacteroidota bacterium]
MALLIAPLATLFSAFLNYGLFKDYFTPKIDHNKSELIIDRLYHNTYIEKRILKSDIIHNCFDISVKDQPYVIRLSDNFHSDKWNEIHEKFSTGDTLKILYAKHLLQDTILNNPDEVKINNVTVISFSERKSIQFYMLLGITVMTLLFGYVSVIAYKTYVDELLDGDKKLYKKSKWKLFGRWILD